MCPLETRKVWYKLLPNCAGRKRINFDAPLNLGKPSLRAARQALEIQGGACVYAFMERCGISRFKGAVALMRLCA